MNKIKTLKTMLKYTVYMYNNNQMSQNNFDSITGGIHNEILATKNPAARVAYNYIMCEVIWWQKWGKGTLKKGDYQACYEYSENECRNVYVLYHKSKCLGTFYKFRDIVHYLKTGIIC